MRTNRHALTTLISMTRHLILRGGHRRLRELLFAAVLAASAPASALESPSPPPTDSLETIIVNVTPVMGIGIPLNQVPINVQTLRAPQFDRDHAQTLTDEVQRHLASLSLADAEGNPFQQNLVTRGFLASPVLGTP